MPLFEDTPAIRDNIRILRVACIDKAFQATVQATFDDDTADPFDSRDIILAALGNIHSQRRTATRSEFQPENLHEAWELLAEYIEMKGKYTKNLQREYPEAFETWGLIMPYPFDGICNDDGEKIYLEDLLGYINGELHTNVPPAALPQYADMPDVLQSMHALLRLL